MKTMRFVIVSFVLAFTAAASPPSNDAFSARLALVTGVTSTATTAEATVEAGEPRPSWLATNRYQASVWWKWTAPSNGWFEATTAGSLADTVLVVSTGTAVNALTIAFANDDDVRANLNFSSVRSANLALPHSRVIFQAVSGTQYNLAVATSTNGAGPVSLLIRPSVQASPRITALSFSPQPVNVTAASPKGTMTVTIQSDTDFVVGNFFIYGNTNGYAARLAQFSATQRTSGTATNGTYTVTFNPPAQLPSGTMAWGLVLQAGAGEISAYGRFGQCMSPAGVPDTFTVTNTGTVDLTAPVIASVTVSPTNVDTTTSYQDFTVTIHATDALSGVGTILVSAVSTNGMEFMRAIFDSSTRISGTTNDGVYQSAFAIEFGYADPVGKFSVRVQAQDAAGNLGPVLDSTQAGFPGPFTGWITVTQAVPDITVSQFTFTPAQVDVSSNDQPVVVSVDVSAAAGIYSAEFTLFMPHTEEPFMNGINLLRSGTMVSGTATSGRWQATYIIPRGYPPGLATIQARFFTPTDTWSYGPRGSNPLPAGSSNGIAIANNGAVDLKPPQVDFLAGSDPIFQDNCGEGMEAVLRISDDVAGVNGVSTQLVGTAQIQGIGFNAINGDVVHIYPLHRFSGDERSGLYRLELPAYSSYYGTALTPTNYVLNVMVSDRAGRTTTAFRSKRVAVLPLPAAYQSWASANFGFTDNCDYYYLWGPYADQDGDGQSALVEAYFDTNPTVSNAPALFQARNLTNNFEMSWTEPANTHGLAVFPVWSPDLVAWMASGESVPGSAARTLTVDDLGAAPGGGRLKRVLMTSTNPSAAFLRLQLTNAP